MSRTIFTEVNSDRKTLFRKPVPGSGIADMGTTGWGDSSSPPGTEGAESMETAGMSAQSLKEKQQEAILDQVMRNPNRYKHILVPVSLVYRKNQKIVEYEDDIKAIQCVFDVTTQLVLIVIIIR